MPRFPEACCVCFGRYPPCHSSSELGALSALVLVKGFLKLSVYWEGKGGAPWLAHTAGVSVLRGKSHAGAKLGIRWLAEKEKPEEVLGPSGSKVFRGFGDMPECRHSERAVGGREQLSWRFALRLLTLSGKPCPALQSTKEEGLAQVTQGSMESDLK